MAQEREQELTAALKHVSKDAAFSVDASPLNTSGLIGQFRDHPPPVIIIDLDRLPSHGREVAVALRQSKSTRRIPIVFAGGADEKVARVREELPDAIFAPWSAIAPAVKKALKGAPREPVQPIAHMARYTGSPLAKRLDLKPNVKCALLGAPEGFEEQIGEAIEGLEFPSRITRDTALTIWFVRSRRELEAAALDASVRMPDGGSVWLAYPKQAGRHRTDFNQNDLRAVGLAAGLVDYKVCAIDADWSALKFARKSAAKLRTRAIGRATSRASRTA